jgi:hypothetical protein
MPEQDANIAGILAERCIKALVNRPAMSGITTTDYYAEKVETILTTQALAAYFHAVNPEGTLFLQTGTAFAERPTDLRTGISVVTTSAGATADLLVGDWGIQDDLDSLAGDWGIQDDIDSSRREPIFSGTRTESMPEAIIQNWQLLATSGLTEQSYLSLLRLVRKSPGWRGEGSRSLEYESLENFLHFWMGVKEESVEPEFGLAPNGNLRAEWYKDKRHFVELEFRADDDCIFGIFDGKTVFEGRASATNIIQLLETRDFRPLKWSYGG